MASTEIPVVETERLRLRGPELADASEWAVVLEADPNYLQYVPTRPGPVQARADRFVQKYIDRWTDSALSMGWSITLKATNAVVGFAGVEAASESDGEIDYFIFNSHWRRGYASEAAEVVTNYWFRTTTGDCLIAYVIPENVGSVRAVEKLGYRRVASVNYLDLMGNPAGVTLKTPDAAEYRLTRQEWEQR